MLRTVLLFAGGTALVAWAVLLCIAVFTETGTDDAVDTWLAVGMVGACIATGISLTIMVTHPGWPTGLAGALIAIGSAVAGWLVYSVMPDPGGIEYIPHRLMLAAFGYGFGVVGGGMLVLGEMATDGKVPEAKHRPPVGMAARMAVVSVAIVVVGATVGVPAMHDWTDAANTDATRASLIAPTATALNLAGTKVAGTAAGGMGTAGGLLTFDQSGKNASVAVTMRDAKTGGERWHNRRWNRVVSGPPILSADSRLVALSGKRRDDASKRYTTIINAVSGRQRADIRIDGDPGELAMVTDSRVIYVTGRATHGLTARNYAGQPKWTYKVPNDCAMSAVKDDGERVIVGLACRADTSTKDHSRVVSLNAGTGKRLWQWRAEAIGQIYAHGLLVTRDRVVVDVRRDDSPNDSLFAARKYHHDLNALSIEDGKENWRRKDLFLGNTYAPACAGSIQLAGAGRHTGRVILGECHQDAGKAGAMLDVAAYSLATGEGQYAGHAALGYAPARGVDTSLWFAGLPDGRTVLTADASSNLHEPRCRMYVVGPEKTGQVERLPVPKDLRKKPWCQAASIHVTPNSLAVTYPTGTKGTELNGEFFAFD